MTRVLLLLFAAAFTTTCAWATDLEIEKQALSETVRVGQEVSFSLVVRNTSTAGGGPLDSPQTTVLDALPAGLEFVRAASSVGSCEFDGSTVRCDLGTFTAGSTAEITITVRAAQAGVITNEASVSGQFSDPDESNNSSSATITVQDGGFSITKAVSSGPTTRPFDALTYRIEVETNEPADQLVVKDELPELLVPPQSTFLKADRFFPSAGVKAAFEGVENGSCQVSGGTNTPWLVTCTFDDVPAGQTITITLSSKATPVILDEICNTASLEADTPASAGLEVVGDATACVDPLERFVLYEEARGVAMDLGECPATNPNCSAARITLSEGMLADSQICPAIEGGECYALPGPGYVVYVDRAPGALFGKDYLYGAVPAVTALPAPPDADLLAEEGLPRVLFAPGDTEGTSIHNLEDVVEPAVVQEPFVLEIGNPPASGPASVCALVVTGRPLDRPNTGDHLGFQETAGLMTSYLTSQIGLATTQIERLDNPTPAELIAKLTSLQGKCDELYFYYVGHGLRKTARIPADGIILKGPRPNSSALFEHAALAKAVLGVGAKKNFVLLETCFSGTAEMPFRAEANKNKQDLILLMSASADKQAQANVPVANPDGTLKTDGAGQPVTTGAFTSAFVQYAKNPAADLDKDGAAEFHELDAVMKKFPPTFDVPQQGGGTRKVPITTLQGPKSVIIQHQTNTGTQSSFQFEDAGVTVDVRNGKQAGFPAIEAIRVEEVRPRGGDDPEVSEVVALTEGRHRRVEFIEAGTDGFLVNLTFEMNAVLDSLATEAFPGLVSRADTSEPWMPVTRSIWDPADSTLTVLDVTASADYAVAWTTTGTAVSNEASTTLPERFELTPPYPNPLRSSATVQVALPEPADLNVTVYDLAGRRVRELAQGSYPAGTHALRFDASTLSAGVYLIRLVTPGRAFTRKAVVM
ncbi:MAG: T9SS type A sorting domain-containing protein [Bacteroidota bacterium]